LAGHTSAAPRFTTPETYTPKHLAERILLSRAALEGERKQVTVLFADLKGSMELLTDRDPEEARRILDPVLEQMMEAVHRYEGTVNQVMGDGIMALFGAPVAHEDHAVRACYAALRMQDSVKRYAEAARRDYGINAQIRIGLNSGDVVVRAIGSDLRMDYTAVGQTTHLAARMEQLATPGTTLLTPSTLALVEDLVAVTSLGPVSIKGIPEPLEVFELTGAGQARTRLHAAARRGLTQFVGRDNELEQLRRALELAGRGHGQVVAVVGEAGVGKSRLVYEFVHSHRLQGWAVLQAAAVSYGKTTSYLPVIDLLTSYFKIQERDDLRDVQERVTGRLLTLDRGLETSLPALRALLDLPVEDAPWHALAPALRRERTLDAVRRLLLREAREQPLLVIFEDLHWIDSETHALLDRLVESLGSANLLLLVTYRPEYQHTWAGKSYYRHTQLDALPPESTAELLNALLGDDPSLTPLKQLLVRRGNPFFLEEAVHTLVETKALAGEPGRYRLVQPVRSIQVPRTVQAMLEARIDRLPSDDKRLLQVASVVGKDVSFVLLQAIVDLPEEALQGGLDRLQAGEFLYEIGLYPHPEYSFKHALTHEVAYGGLLQERRRELHAQIVHVMETSHADRLTEHLERLAHHAYRGALGEKAAGYLRQAGLKAASRSALEDARTWLEQALEVLDGMPESRTTLEQGCDVRVELRPVLIQLGEGASPMSRLREAMVFAEKLGDERRQVRVGALLTNQHAILGQLDTALATGVRALDTAVRLGDVQLRILTTSYLEHAHHYRGDYDIAVKLAFQNLSAIQAESAPSPSGSVAPTSVYDRWVLIKSLVELGRFAEALTHEAEIIRVAEPTRHPYTISMAYFAAGTLHLFRGEWVKTQSLLGRGIDIALGSNVLLLLPPVIADHAWVLATLGQRSEALNGIRRGEELVERHAGKGVVAQRGWAYHSLGRASLQLGNVDEALRLAQRSIDSSPHYHGFVAHTQCLLGDIKAYPDRFDADGSEVHYHQALALAEPRGMRPLIAHCRRGLGKLHARTGQRHLAQEHLTTATTMYREMGMQFWLERAEAELRSG